MIISNLRHAVNLVTPSTPLTLPEIIESLTTSSSGQSVTVESANNVATAYRCINVISDDVAKMPLQAFISRSKGKVERMRPSNWEQNIAWLLEVSPNRWMTPFVFKKTVIKWLITHGNAYVWEPPRWLSPRRELFILPTTGVLPMYDLNGNLWYQVTFANRESEFIPGVEVMNLVINSTDGITGRGVITFARESIGRQLGAYETQGKFYAQGLNPGGILWVNGEANKDARAKIRDAYTEAMSGSENAYRLAVMDNKVSKFEQITMKPVDAQFLQSIEHNDLEIANFFGMPLHKLNMGKQAYNSNEQQNLK